MRSRVVPIIGALAFSCVILLMQFVPVFSLSMDDLSNSTMDISASTWSIRISGTPTSGHAPLTVSFEATTSGSTNGSSTLKWDFGDGNSATGNPVSHTYSVAGTYSVSCRLTDPWHSSIRSNRVVITVSKAAPVYQPLTLSISANPTEGIAPLQTYFASSVGGGLAPYSYFWDFGDGQTSREANPSHLYSYPGKYAVSLTVKDDPVHGGQASSSTIITVSKKVFPPLSVSFTANQTNGNTPMTVSFSSIVSGGNPPYKYLWDFGTGDVSYDANPMYTFISVGQRSVTLTVQDNGDGSQIAQAKYTASIVVNEAPVDTSNPVVSISGSTDKGGAPLIVQFSSTVDGIALPSSYLWLFGDGSSSNDPNPTHIYSDPGSYFVTLNVTDAQSKVIFSNTLMVVVEGATPMTQGDTSRGNAEGALLAIGLFGVVAVTMLVMQVAIKRRKG